MQSLGSKAKNYATQATFNVNVSAMHICIYLSCRSLLFNVLCFVAPKEFKLHNLDKGPATTCTIGKEEALNLYTQMQTIRRLETSAGNLYKEKIVRGFCHLYSGQEGCAVGMLKHLLNVGASLIMFV